MKKLIPDKHVPSVYDIDFDTLRKQGIRGVITDLDNTLVAWNKPDATPELVGWLDRLQENGFEVMIVSNNKQTRVSAFADPLAVPFIHRAKKPRRQAYLKALRHMDVSMEETVVVGDQLFTDVLGGNRLGFYTILVVPIAPTDGFFTRLNRRLERVVLAWFKRRGWMTWEE